MEVINPASGSVFATVARADRTTSDDTVSAERIAPDIGRAMMHTAVQRARESFGPIAETWEYGLLTVWYTTSDAITEDSSASIPGAGIYLSTTAKGTEGGVVAGDLLALLNRFGADGWLIDDFSTAAVDVDSAWSKDQLRTLSPGRRLDSGSSSTSTMRRRHLFD